MMMKHIFSIAAVGMAALTFAAPIAHGQGFPQTMNFQGRLAKPDGTPLPDTNAQSLTFRLFDAPDGGNLLWEQTIDSIAVHNGTFAAHLDFANNYQNGNTEMSAFANPLFTPYLEIQVGSDAPLAPRQAFASVAYALVANVALSVPDGSITDSNIVSVDWSKITNVPAGMGGVWALNGNAGINPVTDFLGTADNQPLLLKVNNYQAMRYDYVERGGKFAFRTVNVLGGSPVNSIGADVAGATIAGGGKDYLSGSKSPNVVNGDFGTIGGGQDNTVSGSYGTIGGGANNAVGGGINGAFDTVGGGGFNVANGGSSVVSGGIDNTASGITATIAGGQENIASGAVATVAGGWYNTAAGQNSFAAGFGAQALHDGTFVWADNQSAVLADPRSFASTGENQFLIRAAGGVGINTNSWFSTALTVVAPGITRTAIQGITATSGGIAVGGSVQTLMGYGVYGNNTISGNVGFLGDRYRGVYGSTGSGGSYGVEGYSAGGIGIYGHSDTGTGILGQSGNASHAGGYFKNTAGGTALYAEGFSSVGTLEIRGGADLAEKFDVTGKIEAGMVVEIDAEHEGKLCLSRSAYNRRVAGVISGANRLSAGVVLTDPSDKSPDALPVAMSGRVWVWCDATECGVEPGDFLTTAVRPGYAMPAPDLARAQGALLGKAMTRLEKGKVGLVLTLVNLQ